MQADMIMEKEQRLERGYIPLVTGVTWDNECDLNRHETILKVTHFLQQCHAYTNKAVPPNGAIPAEFMGAIYI